MAVDWLAFVLWLVVMITIGGIFSGAVTHWGKYRGALIGLAFWAIFGFALWVGAVTSAIPEVERLTLWTDAVLLICAGLFAGSCALLGADETPKAGLPALIIGVLVALFFLGWLLPGYMVGWLYDLPALV